MLESLCSVCLWFTYGPVPLANLARDPCMRVENPGLKLLGCFSFIIRNDLSTNHFVLMNRILVFLWCAGWLPPRSGEHLAGFRAHGRRGHIQSHGRRQGGVHRVYRCECIAPWKYACYYQKRWALDSMFTGFAEGLYSEKLC